MRGANLRLRWSRLRELPNAGLRGPAWTRVTAAMVTMVHPVERNKKHTEQYPLSGEEPALEASSYNGNGYEDLRPHLCKFFKAVRSRKPVARNAIFGHNAALACHLANESYSRKSPVYWDDASETLKSLG